MIQTGSAAGPALLAPLLLQRSLSSLNSSHSIPPLLLQPRSVSHASSHPLQSVATFILVPGPLTFIIFQMFVRLFVDENLDRHVPISKQPKEKIQAIIDSCTRQFPEYAERPRKRIRTYLKSCRRTKRSREQAGLDTNNVSAERN